VEVQNQIIAEKDKQIAELIKTNDDSYITSRDLSSELAFSKKDYPRVIIIEKEILAKVDSIEPRDLNKHWRTVVNIATAEVQSGGIAPEAKRLLEQAAEYFSSRKPQESLDEKRLSHIREALDKWSKNVKLAERKKPKAKAKVEVAAEKVKVPSPAEQLLLDEQPKREEAIQYLESLEDAYDAALEKISTITTEEAAQPFGLTLKDIAAIKLVFTSAKEVAVLLIKDLQEGKRPMREVSAGGVLLTDVLAGKEDLDSFKKDTAANLQTLVEKKELSPTLKIDDFLKFLTTKAEEKPAEKV